MPRPKILTFGQAESSIDASMIQALVANGNVYSATSNFQSVVGGNNGAFSIFNPTVATSNVLLYAVRVSTDTNSVRVVGATLTADTALGSTATIINKGRTAVINASQMSAKFSNNAGAAPSAGTTYDCCILQVGYPLPYDATDVGNLYLTPTNGCIYHLVHPSGAAFGFTVTMEWAEFLNT